jgi:hypothetical protein
MAGSVTADRTDVSDFTDFTPGLTRFHNQAPRRYYKLTGVLPPTWKYESSTASTMVA